MRQIRAAEKLIRKKRRQYENQNRQFTEMQPDPFLQEYLDRTTFRNKDGEICEFTSLQKHDLNLVCLLYTSFSQNPICSVLRYNLLKPALIVSALAFSNKSVL